MTLTVAIVLYDGMTALDAVGPLEVLRFLPDAEPALVSAQEAGSHVATDVPAVRLGPTVGLDEVTAPDVVVVPGGPGTAGALSSPLVPWLSRVHPATRWTTSVCSGSLILGAAGLLGGLRATTHFSVADKLALFGARAVPERVVVEEHARIITAAGVSSGIDMALQLAERLSDPVTAKAIQLIVEYAPEPPHPNLTVATAGPDVLRRVHELGAPHGAIPADWRPEAP